MALRFISWITLTLPTQFLSQIRLRNYTISGNDLLIRWTIFPAESANSFTTAKAMGIILRLREHQLQLPQKFGSYQLVKLKVEPQIKQSWWEQHSWVVAVGVSVTLVLGLLALGTWLVWRYRSRETIPYEPVDAIVPGAIVAEQELQPLK